MYYYKDTGSSFGRIEIELHSKMQRNWVAQLPLHFTLNGYYLWVMDILYIRLSELRWPRQSLLKRQGKWGGPINLVFYYFKEWI